MRVSFHVLRQQRFSEMQSRRKYAAAGAVDKGGHSHPGRIIGIFLSLFLQHLHYIILNSIVAIVMSLLSDYICDYISSKRLHTQCSFAAWKAGILNTKSECTVSCKNIMG